MIVTHLFQVLGFVAMEPPTSLSAKALVDETVKVFEAMAPVRAHDAESPRVLTVAFREPPRRMFAPADRVTRNELVFDLSDRGGIAVRFNAKVPGPEMRLGEARFRFDYDDSFGTAHELEAYERLIHDALVGDATLFTRADGIERLWERSAALLDSPPPVRVYSPGSWGPLGTEQLVPVRGHGVVSTWIETDAFLVF